MIKFSLLLAAAIMIAASALVLLLGTFATAVPVDIYAGDFLHLGSKKLAGYSVRYEETNTTYVLNANGALTLDIPAGSNVTFTLLGDDKYVETQTATSTVPPEGLSGKYNEIVIQAPSMDTFDLLNWVVPHKRNFSLCQVVVTVCAFQKSWYNCPQGWPGVVATLHPNVNQDVFYFGTWGALSNDTNPLPNKLTASSWDGGVLFSNIPFYPGQEFKVTAQFGNAPFTETRIKCLRPGMRLINAAPNQGPRAQVPLSSLPDPDNC